MALGDNAKLQAILRCQNFCLDDIGVLQPGYNPAASLNASALSVFSQLNSSSSRPKCP